MTLRPAILLLGAACLPGCYGAEIRRLELGLDQARQENAALAAEVRTLEHRAGRLEREIAAVRDETGQARGIVDAGAMTIADLERAWAAFDRDYSPELRAALDQNLSDSSIALRKLQEDRDAGASALGRLRAHEEEAAHLAGRAARHEAEARASNVVLVLREERNEIRAEAARAAQAATSAHADASEAHAAANRARAAADEAADLSQHASREAARAHHAAADARSGLDHLSHRISRVDQHVDSLDGRVCSVEHGLAAVSSRPVCTCRQLHVGR